MDGLNPDEQCGVCLETRENHGDKLHQFSEDGQLIQLEKREAPRQAPPAHRDDVAQGKSGGPEARALATLVEILAEKELLTTKDIIRIFSGQG